jgi:hypothetical protein
MARARFSKGVLATVAVALIALTTSQSASAGNTTTLVYNNYGDAVYHTNATTVSYPVGGGRCGGRSVYIPANYPVDFVVPRAAAVCRPPAYRGAVYVERRPSFGISFGFGWSSGCRPRACYPRAVHKVRRGGHRRVYASHRSSCGPRPWPAYRTVRGHHRSHRAVRCDARPHRPYRYHRPHGGGQYRRCRR